MMGPSHAFSGAAAAFTAAGTASVLAGHPVLDPIRLLLFATVTAGAALLPDLDVEGAVLKGRGCALAGRAFGRVSMAVAEGVSHASVAYYQATAGERDPKSKDGHRKLTHTWLGVAIPGAIAVGTTLIPGRGGWIATLVVLFICAGMAVRGVAHHWAAKHGWIGTTLAAGVVTLVTALSLPQQGMPALGVAVALGCAVHIAGDMYTVEGCPIGGPHGPRDGVRWRYRHLTIRILRFHAGKRVEKWLVLPVLAGATAVAAWWALS